MAASVIAKSTAPTRNRGLLITAGSESSTEEMQNLANWEMKRRQAQRFSWLYTVQGWTGQNALWKPGTKVKLTDSLIYHEDELMVATVTYDIDEDHGTICTLELIDMNAFAYQPVENKTTKTNNPKAPLVQIDPTLEQTELK